ncbi:MAG: VTT domain-containing protein [archaeon]|jgi:membrane protein YqaA with SNARE-associated domain
MVFDLIGFVTLTLFQWLTVFAVNIIPAMMPPTWAVLSFFYITSPQNIWLLVLIGVTASTCGRYALAKLSGYITSKFANKQKREEFDSIKEKLQGKPLQKFVFTLIYALSPLPSNALFIAFGATKTKLAPVLAGFFVGRTISYLFLVFTTQKVFSSFESTLAGNASLWTIMIEIIGVVAVLGFFLVDWNKMIQLGGEPAKKKRKWEKI